MWQALRELVDNVKQAVGLEVPAVPDPSAVADAASDAAGQAGEAAAAATDAAASAADDAAGAVTGVGEQISSRVSDFLGRFDG